MSKNAKRRLKEYQQKQTREDIAKLEALRTRLKDLTKQVQNKENCLDSIVHDLKSQEASAINNGGTSELDSIVHDLKSQEASAINNGGTSEQVEFLVEHWGEEEAIKLIEGALS